jgi:phosphate transport system substrate-binding protein
LYIRDPISGTHIGFKELAMGNQEYGSGAGLFTNYLGIVQAVAKDPNGVGYSGLDPVQHAGTRTIAIGDVAPDAATVNQQKYPYARVLRFYINGLKESPKTREFIDFVLSTRGQEVMVQMGYAPRP